MLLFEIYMRNDYIYKCKCNVLNDDGLYNV